MFKRFALCCTLLFAPLFAMANSVIEEDNYYLHTYDRFTKNHTYAYRSDYQEIGSDDEVIAHLIENPMILNSPQETSFVINIIFRHTDDAGEYDFTECGDVDWLVDDRVTQPIHQAQVSARETGLSGDNLFNMMSETSFKAIMNSKKAEYRVCGTNEFELDNDTKKGMKRAYANYLKNKTQ